MSLDEESPYAPPVRTRADNGLVAGRAALAGIPWVGGPILELLSGVLRPPLERRRDEWMRNVGEALADLTADRGVRVEELRDNPAFVDAVLMASQSALRTSSQEKLAALRNAILNSGLPGAPDPDRQALYLSIVDSLTPTHLAALEFSLLQDEIDEYETTGRRLELHRDDVPQHEELAYLAWQADHEAFVRGRRDALHARLLDPFGGDAAFVAAVCDHLRRNGLLRRPAGPIYADEDALTTARPSAMGRELWAFIKAPRGESRAADT